MATLTDPRPALNLVVDRLRQAEFEVNLDPAKVNPGAVGEDGQVTPAAWVKWLGYGQSMLLSGDEFVWVEVYCLVPDMPYPDAIGALVDVASKVVDVLGFPDGLERQQATRFGDAREVPTLVLPYLVENPPAE